jgi:Domain of unknown function (DUF1905)/Bacteriocin-protection, YdeI or OmpD-Associated
MKPIFKKVVTMEKYPGKGGWTYAALDGVHQNSHRLFGMLRVHGTIDHCELKQYNVMPMSDGRLFLPIKKSFRKILKKEAGDTVNITLYCDDSPLEIPQDLQLCFNDDPYAVSQFNKLNASVKKKHIDYINAAKKIETKANRISQLMNELLEL